MNLLQYSTQVAEILSVEPTAGSFCVAFGQAVTVVFYADGCPWIIHARVVSSDPLAIETHDPAVLQLELDRKVVVLAQEAGTIVKADAHVVGCSRGEDGWRIAMEATPWETSERRRYPRFGLRLAVTLRQVEERAGVAELIDVRGETEDISIGGAWVRTRDLLPEGTLVEFRSILSDTETFRSLAIVTHSNEVRGGMGIEFVEYLSGARGTLDAFLGRAA